MARRDSNLRFGYLLLSLIIAAVLWGVAHGRGSTERPADIPVVFENIPEQLVITSRNVDAVNVRVRGSRAALSNVDPDEYRVDVSNANAGPAIYEVDTFRIEEELPRGARLVAHSPSSIEVTFERRGRKSVRVRPDLEGELAQNFEIKGVEVEPPRVWLTGARSDVLRLSEVVTETIDIAGLTETTEREVGLSLGGGHVWMEERSPVRVRIEVAVKPLPSEEVEQGG